MDQSDLWQAERLPAEGVKYGAEEAGAPTQFLATRRKAGRYRIHVNVGFRLSEQQLRDYFSQFGPLTDVYLPKHRSGRVKGFGFCTFESEADLNKVLQISDHVVVGVLVRINRAGPRPEFISVSKLERARSSRQASQLFSRTATRAPQDSDPQGLSTGGRRLSLDSSVNSRGRVSDALLAGASTDQASTGSAAGGVPGLSAGPRRRSLDTRLLRPGFEDSFLQQDQQGFASDARPLLADVGAAWHTDSAGNSSLSSTASEAWRASVDPSQLAGSPTLPPLPFSGTVLAQAQSGFTDGMAVASTHRPWHLNYSSQQAALTHPAMQADSPLLQQLLQQQQQQQQQQAVTIPFSQGLCELPTLQHACGADLISTQHQQVPDAGSLGDTLDPNTLGALASAMARLGQVAPIQQQQQQQQQQPQPQPTDTTVDPAGGSWTPPSSLDTLQEMQVAGAGPQQAPSNNLLYQLSMQSSWFA